MRYHGFASLGRTAASSGPTAELALSLSFFENRGMVELDGKDFGKGRSEVIVVSYSA